MNFNSTRFIIEDRMFSSDPKVNAIKHDISLTDKRPGLDIIFNGSDGYKIQTVSPNPTGVYEHFGDYFLFTDGEFISKSAQDAQTETYIVMSIIDSASKAQSFGGKNILSSGFIRFKIFIPNGAPGLRTTAGLIADAIDKRLGFSAGSSTSKNERYPEGEVGGTLSISRGSLKWVENTNYTQTYNLEFQFDYYN